MFPEDNGRRYILTLLRKSPPTRELAIGTTTTLPPSPASFTENPGFLDVLYGVFREHAHEDPEVQASAATYASPGGSAVASARRRGGTAVDKHGSGAGGANVQGGMGGGGIGGWVHICDARNPAPVGRVGDPGDILGSVMVDAQGVVVKGEYEKCGAYRVITNDGM